MEQYCSNGLGPVSCLILMFLALQHGSVQTSCSQRLNAGKSVPSFSFSRIFFIFAVFDIQAVPGVFCTSGTAVTPGRGPNNEAVVCIVDASKG